MVTGKKPQKEEWGLVLDYLPYGSPEDNRPVYQKKPLVQAVGESHFVLMELMLKDDIVPMTQDRVYIGEGDRDVIDHVKRRVTYDDLTHGSQMELPFILEKIILENESKYIDFFNDAYPITNRLHMLELLPGIGKKLMWAIIDEHKKGKFLNFNNLVERVKGLHTPEKLIVHRIIDELMDENIKYRLFTTPAKSRHHK
jgi:putative nucleotide binding protein